MCVADDLGSRGGSLKKTAPIGEHPHEPSFGEVRLHHVIRARASSYPFVRLSGRGILASSNLRKQAVKVRDDRPFAAACADETQEPVDESCEPVLEPRHESDVHDEPREPRDPAGEPYPVRAEDRGAAVHGGHAPEVPVLPRIGSAPFLTRFLMT